MIDVCKSTSASGNYVDAGLVLITMERIEGETLLNMLRAATVPAVMNTTVGHQFMNCLERVLADWDESSRIPFGTAPKTAPAQPVGEDS